MLELAKKNIVFKHFDLSWASGQNLISQYFNIELKLNSKIVNNVNNTKDSIIFFVTKFESNEVLRCKKRNNICIFISLDSYKDAKDAKFLSVFDGIIFPIKQISDEFKKTSKVQCTSIHVPSNKNLHYRLKDKHKQFSLCYAGHISGLMWGNKIAELSVIAISQANKYSCHYSIRKENTIPALYKPASKVIAAAACGSNIITTKDRAAIELLGKNYPYYTNSDLFSVKKTIKFAKKTFNKTEWKCGLKIMEKIKKDTCIENIAKKYLSFIGCFL